MVLVTGADGLLSRKLVKMQIDGGESVKCLDLERTKDLHAGAEFVQADLLDEKILATICRKVDVIFHLLDVKSPHHGGRCFMKRINVKGTRNLLRAAHAAGVKKFIFLSTYEVYGKTEKFPSGEDTPQKPVTRYGKDKLRAERFCQPYIQAGTMDITIFRPSPLVGPGTRNPITLITLLMALGMEEANRIYLAAGGENRFQLLHPADAARAFMFAYKSESTKGKIYNLGSDDVPTQIDQALAVKEKGKLDCVIKYLSASYAKFLSIILLPLKIDYLNKGHVMYLLSNLVLDCQAAKSDLGWRPEYGNVDIILETICWYREEKL